MMTSLAGALFDVQDTFRCGITFMVVAVRCRAVNPREQFTVALPLTLRHHLRRMPNMLPAIPPGAIGRNRNAQPHCLGTLVMQVAGATYDRTPPEA
jgi:hypothetical protein